MSGEIVFEPWFKRDPDLFEVQKKILTDAGFTLDQGVLERDNRIQFTGRSTSDPARELVVSFPDSFPSCPPKIFDTRNSRLLPRHHHFDTRQICLFGFNEHRWSALLSVRQALEEAEEVISESQKASPPTEAEAPEPLTRIIHYEPGASILIPPEISHFNDYDQLDKKEGKFEGRFVFSTDDKHSTQGRGIILELNCGNKKIKASPPFTEYVKFRSRAIEGTWRYLTEPPSAETFYQALRAFSQEIANRQRGKDFWIALIFREEAVQAGQHRTTWVVGHAISKLGRTHLLRTFLYKQTERYARIPTLEGLEQKRATIIGCGSLGSKIAVNLAASGIKGLGLVDCDYYEPNNAVRHELGVSCFGLNKEDALKPRLIELNPALENNCESIQYQIGGAFIPQHVDQQLYQMLRKSDIIIDTAGIHSVSHFLNDMAFNLRRPLLIASVTNGAWSGEIVRIIPGKTPCWICWLYAYDQKQPPSAPLSAGEVFAPGCDQPTFTGTTYDLSIVAGLATSICVETLLANESADLSKNYILWRGKDTDGNMLFSTERLPIPARPECWCSRS